MLSSCVGGQKRHPACDVTYTYYHGTWSKIIESQSFRSRFETEKTRSHLEVIPVII